jgi:Kdo2-lipid IVA lauroyltransferase/acyltransferase
VKRHWKKIRHRIEWLLLMLALKLVPLLPRKFCYQLAGAAGALVARFDAQGRAVALANLEAAFGDEFSPAQRAVIVRESFQHFARTMLDLFWSPRLTPENFTRYMEFEGLERARAETAPDHSCVVASFHYGNFEWLSLAFGWLGFPSSITTQEFKNPLLDGFFQKLREQSGHTTVAREGAIIRLYKNLRRQGRVALLVDTTLPAHQPTVVIECFGLKTMITVAHAWLQERTDKPIIPLFCVPLADGRYRIVIQPKVHLPKGATHQEIAQACWDSFEPIVRKNPAPWLWMYKHWRYKPAGARGYPFYAHESQGFEQIAARPNYAKLDPTKLPETPAVAAPL